MRKGRGTRRPVLVATAALVAVAVYAVTASNTVPATNAGSGAAAISGYTVTNVVYNLNATTPTNIDSTTFTISPTSATTVKIQLVSGGSWYACTNTAGSVSCATTSPQATVAGANQLTVVAVG